MRVTFQEPRWRKDLIDVNEQDADREAFQSDGRIAGLWMFHFIDLAPWYLTNAAGNRSLWSGAKGMLDFDNLRISGDGSRDPNRIARSPSAPS
jgi:hypothetical protein